MSDKVVGGGGRWSCGVGGGVGAVDAEDACTVVGEEEAGEGTWGVWDALAAGLPGGKGMYRSWENVGIHRARGPQARGHGDPSRAVGRSWLGVCCALYVMHRGLGGEAGSGVQDRGTVKGGGRG